MTYFQGIQKAKKEKDSRTYVSTAVMLHTLETSFYHMVAACLALGIEHSELADIKTAIGNTSMYWSRSHESQLDEEYKYEHRFQDPLCNDIMMKYATGVDWETFLLNRDRVYVVRALTNLMLYKLNSIDVFNIHKARSWEADYYKWAELFFREKYPIIDEHVSLRMETPKDWSEKACNNIRSFYKLAAFDSEEDSYDLGKYRNSVKGKGK